MWGAIKKWSNAEKHEIRKLAAEGLSAAKIAAAMKATRNAIVGVCHRNKIKLLGSKRRPRK